MQPVHSLHVLLVLHTFRISPELSQDLPFNIFEIDLTYDSERYPFPRIQARP